MFIREVRGPDKEVPRSPTGRRGTPQGIAYSVDAVEEDIVGDLKIIFNLNSPECGAKGLDVEIGQPERLFSPNLQFIANLMTIQRKLLSAGNTVKLDVTNHAPGGVVARGIKRDRVELDRRKVFHVKLRRP